MNKKINLKPFDQMDWDCYNGAEGVAPLIAYVSSPDHVTLDSVEYQAVIICDDNGLHFDYIDMEDSIQGTWQLDTSFETAKFIVNETPLFTQPITSSRLESLHFYVSA